MVDVLIVGGGLAGSLAAWHLRMARPACTVTLLEAGPVLGGNHTWSFHATDLAAASRRWIAPLVAHRWPRHDVAFPGRRRTIDHEYCSLTSSRLHDVVSAALGDTLRLGTAVETLTPTAVRLTTGEVLEAGVVIDARGGGPVEVPLGWQTFLGQDVVCEAPHGLTHPMLMDATVPQDGAFKFIYVLPWSADRLLIEDTAYADTPGVDAAAARRAIARYTEARGWRVREVVREETGSLPIPLGGRVDAFWHGDVPRIGMRAGLFHPTTGYSLPDAVATAEQLAAMDPFTPARVYSEVRILATRRWQARGFFRLLNRWLFRAAQPSERARILEQFYGRPADLIARFYGARLTAGDHLRLVAGRPPVAVWRALAHLRE
ncbi:MAG: lycopene beta-cyclase CrtY [Acidobacteria bacterium]|nr:lycopene beta-cyclase CrtY [Acidobacteriota bacterium]